VTHRKLGDVVGRLDLVALQKQKVGLGVLLELSAECLCLAAILNTVKQLPWRPTATGVYIGVAWIATAALEARTTTFTTVRGRCVGSPRIYFQTLLTCAELEQLA